jgi:hypothetical protein
VEPVPVAANLCPESECDTSVLHVCIMILDNGEITSA